MAKRRNCPTKIDVYFDNQDGRNAGWAWRAYYRDKHGETYDESGELKARRRNTSLRTLATQARKASGCPRSRTRVVKHD